MAGCIIHVGMHKTGTSSIQHSLQGHADEQFVYFPDPKGHTNHSRAVFSLIGSHGQDRPRFDGDTSPRRWQPRDGHRKEAENALREGIAFARGRKIVFSGEGIIFLSREELESFATIFKKYFDDIMVVAYVRPPAAYITSLLQQLIKGGSMTTFDPGLAYCQYRKSFEKFDAVFGRNRVQLWKFSPGDFPDGCVVRDFCGRIGLSLPRERIVRRNESISREASAAFLAYNKFGPAASAAGKRGGRRRFLIKALGGLGSTKFRLSPSLVQPIIKSNRSDIEWMERRLGQSLDEPVSEEQATDIKGESDLLQTAAGLGHALEKLSGENSLPKGGAVTPEQIALLVHGIYEHVSHGGPGKATDTRAKPTDGGKPRLGKQTPSGMKALLEAVKRDHPESTSGLSDDALRHLVRTLFRRISETIQTTSESRIRFQDWGSFRKGTRSKAVAGPGDQKALGALFRPEPVASKRRKGGSIKSTAV